MDNSRKIFLWQNLYGGKFYNFDESSIELCMARYDILVTDKRTLNSTLNICLDRLRDLAASSKSSKGLAQTQCPINNKIENDLRQKMKTD